MNNLPALGLVLGVAFLVFGGGAVLAIVAIESHHQPKAGSDTVPSTPSTSETPSSGDAAPATPTDTSSTPSTGDSQTPSNQASSPPTSDQPRQPSGGHHQWTGGGPGAGGGGQRGHMFDQLDLTADQQQQIQNIRATITDRQERREAIMKILTPDQQAKLEQLRAQMRGQHGGAGQNPANPTPAPQ